MLHQSVIDGIARGVAQVDERRTRIEDLVTDLHVVASWLDENRHVLAANGMVPDSMLLGWNCYSSIQLEQDTPEPMRELIRNDVLRKVGLSASLLAKLGKVDKHSGQWDYTVSTRVSDRWPSVRVQARAAVNDVCTIVEHDELVEVEELVYPDPVKVTKTVKRTEKICPPSLLAAI